ncbi:hypothetical protein TSUD_112050 [Trifolium subterraneum]|uniref:Protein CHUP1, chloroplastic n=1 Tax=Trifolium subterraneum TaxID=3900 RepID=A0A2Z6LVJ9_TRISU|nr:hypothetical protein TSUD_112050 [Trifolium subterraneum]
MVIMIKKEKGMKPILVNFGLALALSFAGFICSRLRITRINHSSNSSTSGHESEVNLGDDLGAKLSTSNIASEEETRTNELRSENSPIDILSNSKQNGDKDEFLLPEFDELVKEVKFEVEAPRLKVGSSRGYTVPDKDDYEQEISHLRNMVRLLQDKEQNLEFQLLEYCDLEELVYMRWINACLRYELRNYQPPHSKTVAKDLNKSLSPNSEKKAKQLILEYADANGSGSIVDFDFDQWSSSQASSITDSGEYDDFSSVDNSSAARSNTKFFSKLKRLMQGKDSRHHDSRVSTRYQEDINSPRPSTSTGIDRRASFDFSTSMSVKERDRRYSSLSRDGSLPGVLGIEKSDLEKYAEALKNSSVHTKYQRRGRSTSFS